MEEKKLNLAFVDYGLGKYYNWGEKRKLYHFIEMNLDMLNFDVELFCWVFNHELDHYRFFKNPENRGRKDYKNELIHMFSSGRDHFKMYRKLFGFEKKYPIKSHTKKFVVYNIGGEIKK